MKKSLTHLAVLILLLGATASAEKPNIILIVMDDLGYSDISPYGQREILTPNLSKMAERGISFLPELTGKPQLKHEFLYWEYHTKGGDQAVRMGNWKGIRSNGGANPEIPIQLFNLQEDIGEEKNVADLNSKIVNRIRKLMDTQHTRSDIFPFAIEKN